MLTPSIFLYVLIYLIVMDGTFADGRERIFLSPKGADDSASHKYCKQLKKCSTRVYQNL
jgi:hypothetical protein